MFQFVRHDGDLWRKGKEYPQNIERGAYYKGEQKGRAEGEAKRKRLEAALKAKETQLDGLQQSLENERRKNNDLAMRLARLEGVVN